MPTIESKKYPGNIRFVPADVWENEFKAKGLDRRYKVIDDSDIQATVIPTPKNIVEFTEVEKAESPIKETVQEIPDRETLKTKLTDLGVEFNPRTSTEKLQQLYTENK